MLEGADLNLLDELLLDDGLIEHGRQVLRQQVADNLWLKVRREVERQEHRLAHDDLVIYMA